MSWISASEVSDLLIECLFAADVIVESRSSREKLGLTQSFTTLALNMPHLWSAREEPFIEGLFLRAQESDAAAARKLVRAAREWCLPHAKEFATAGYHEDRLKALGAYPAIMRGADSWHRLAHWLVIHAYYQFDHLEPYVTGAHSRMPNMDLAIQVRARRADLPPRETLIEVGESLAGELAAIGTHDPVWLTLNEVSLMFVQTSGSHPSTELIRTAILERPEDPSQQKAIPRHLKKGKSWVVNAEDAKKYFPQYKNWRLVK